MKRLFRNANIGVAVGAIPMFGGAILFHANDEAYTATTVASFAIGMVVYLGLASATSVRVAWVRGDNEF